MKNTSLATKFAGYEDYLQKRIRSGVKNVRKLFDEIKDQGYTGSYDSLNRFLRPQLKKLITKPYKISRRVETNPGEQAQVDWGSFGKIIINGKEERLSAFVYVLSYSRMLFVQFTVKQNLQTFFECHKNAFAKLGVPRKIRYDNVKTVVLRRERIIEKYKHHFNPAFFDFSLHYNFIIDPCPPYWPRSKGKVEAAVKYLRNNFMQGRRFRRDYSSLEDLNQQVLNWLDRSANQREHGTTGEKPGARYEVEKPVLRFLGEFPTYETSPFQERHSDKDALVQHNYNSYSVPEEFARKKLFVREINENGVLSLHIYNEDKIIAEHLLTDGKGKTIELEEHRAKPTKLKKVPTTKERFDKYGAVIYSRPLSYYDRLIPEVKNVKVKS